MKARRAGGLHGDLGEPRPRQVLGELDVVPGDDDAAGGADERRHIVLGCHRGGTEILPHAPMMAAAANAGDQAPAARERDDHVALTTDRDGHRPGVAAGVAGESLRLAEASAGCARAREQPAVREIAREPRDHQLAARITGQHRLLDHARGTGDRAARTEAAVRASQRDLQPRRRRSRPDAQELRDMTAAELDQLRVATDVDRPREEAEARRVRHRALAPERSTGMGDGLTLMERSEDPAASQIGVLPGEQVIHRTRQELQAADRAVRRRNRHRRRPVRRGRLRPPAHGRDSRRRCDACHCQRREHRQPDPPECGPNKHRRHHPPPGEQLHLRSPVVGGGELPNRPSARTRRGEGPLLPPTHLEGAGDPSRPAGAVAARPCRARRA